MFVIGNVMIEVDKVTLVLTALMLAGHSVIFLEQQFVEVGKGELADFPYKIPPSPIQPVMAVPTICPITAPFIKYQRFNS